MLKVDVVSREAQYLALTLQGDLDLAGIEALVQALVPYRSEIRNLVLDCANVGTATQDGVQGLNRMAAVLSKKSRHLRIVNATAALKAPLGPLCVTKEQALQDVTKGAAGAAPSPNTVAIDPVILKHVIVAVESVFKLQAGLDTKCGTPEPLREGDRGDTRIASLLSLVSETVKGTLLLCFPEATFLAVVSKMFGEPHKTIGPENADAAGELLNIVFGAARRHINEAGYRFQPAIPSVVRGVDLTLSHGGAQGAATAARIPCTSEAGPFHVEISVKNVSNEEHKK